MLNFDIVIVTDKRYVLNSSDEAYSSQVIREDQLLLDSLVAKKLKVKKTSWDDPDMNWSDTKHAMIRTTWDIYDDGKFELFLAWLEKVKKQTNLVNPYTTIKWNIDKHYLLDLEKKGINIPPTVFIEPNDERSLSEIVKESGWKILS